MPRPTTKKELLEASEQKFQEIWDTIDSLSTEQAARPFDFSNYPKLNEAHWSRDKNLRDILVHLHEWHELFIYFVKNNSEGNQVPFLPPPHTFRNLKDINMVFWKKHQETSYEESIQLLTKSNRDVMKLLKTFSNEELYTKKYYNWTGTTSLGSYAVSATSSHYDWAIKKIKKHKKINS